MSAQPAVIVPATAPPSPETLDRTIAVMRTVLKRRFGIDDPGLSPDRELASLGLDSLAFIEYAFELEQDLDVHLPDLPRDMVTVGDFARFVAAEVDKAAGSAPAQ